MSCYFVTGCAGFIASKVAELLLKDGHQVVGIDNMNDYYDVRLKEMRLENLNKFDNFTFYKYDVENYDNLKELFEKYDFEVVYNLAARAGIRYSIKNPHVYLASNTQGPLNILELMKEYGIKKYIMASTSSVYSGKKPPFIEDMNVDTQISPYAATKRSAELLGYTYHFLYGIDVSILRYFTVYGPYGRPDMAVFRFIKWIDEGTPITVYGDGTQSRDFTYVDDIAKGTIKASRDVGYEIINLGGGNDPYSLKDLISHIEKRLGKKAVIDEKPFNREDMKVTWADITKAKKVIDWEPEVGFYDGVDKSIEWYLENKDRLKDISVESL